MVGLQIVEYPEKLSELFDGYLLAHGSRIEETIGVEPLTIGFETRKEAHQCHLRTRSITHTNPSCR